MIIADKDDSGVGEVRKGTERNLRILQGFRTYAELFDEEGYLKTGDLGYLDKENYLYLKRQSEERDRYRGGKNVYPEEI